ncbi:FG-GAP-like repeat-containing protein [Alloyangia pacifica]|uniref:Repeat domain-containing protein n=1 Tax=Alloyangia pacifica TaxID=311180 RepID=A0A1I6WJC5_9RHOB|nr:FG-GAP-like repeat-containing protein [Alloyangia pacifica]SDI82698.1 Repeat domain-containing protein [Alloyangia pacifica]SFT26070.1 Repeat domain-containing protein [Alloyangia pacifica]
MPGNPLSDSVFSFPASLFTTPVSVGRTEAEDLMIGAGFAVRSNPHASGKSYLQATGDASQAGGIFSGPGAIYHPSGMYDITIGYFDETDGFSEMELVVNDIVVASFTWDSLLGSEIVTPQARAEFTAFNVALEAGDTIELRGSGDGSEPLRTDYIDIVATTPPYGETIRIEAEDFTVVEGFSVVQNGAASDMKTLQHTSGGGARAEYVVQHSGLFDLTIAYFDETDGISNLSYGINYGTRGSWQFNDTTGDAIASKGSLRTITFTDLRLEAGDVLNLSGAGDGGEPLRIDYVELFSAEPPSSSVPTPDFWFAEASTTTTAEFVTAVYNDGTATFIENAAGIRTDYRTLMSIDYDGDGDDDFIEVQGPFDIYPYTEPGRVETINFAFRPKENVGGGEFIPTPNHIVQIDIDVDTEDRDDASLPEDMIMLHDVGDADGDGDLDLLATSYLGERVIVFGNDGNGNFSVLSQSPATVGDGNNDARFADFNGDGLQDVVVFSAYDYNAMTIMLNDGSGSYVATESYAPSDAPMGDPHVVDIDHDGDMDVLFVVGGEGRGIYGWLNDGSGYSQAGDKLYIDPMDGALGSFEVADFDGDGLVELVTAGITQDPANTFAGLRTYKVVNTTSGKQFALGSAQVSLPQQQGGNVQAAADYDLDGDVDLLLATGIYTETELKFLENNGYGFFNNTGAIIEPFEASDYFWGPRVHTAFFDDGTLLS